MSSNDVVTLAVTVLRNPYIPEVVDLGLPSGIKWASFNLGATKPEEFGDYYAWGELDKSYGYFSSYSYTDNPTTLPLSRDVARAKLKGTWRMPTNAEFQALVDGCNKAWVTVGGQVGLRLTSKTTGNSIFLRDSSSSRKITSSAKAP